MNDLQDPDHRPTILIVDDTPQNLSLMRSLLQVDYKLRAATNGSRALEIARSESPPDLILLDIMMPGQDGYEVCGLLKTNSQTANIPVIFITARRDEQDEARGFELGAADYIIKPFSNIVVRARVRMHLEKRASEQALRVAKEAAESNNAILLSTLEDLRKTQAQLIQSEKMASLGQLVANVAHEINTPIGAVKSSGKNIADSLVHALTNLPKLIQSLDTDHLGRFLRLIHHANVPRAPLSTREERVIIREVTCHLEASGIVDARRKAGILVELGAQSALADAIPLLRHPDDELILDTAYSIATIITNTLNINTAVDRVAKIIFALKAFSHTDDSGEYVKVHLQEGIDTVLTIYHNQMKHGIELIRQYEEIPPINCLPDELNQVWTNLIHNALQAMNNKGSLKIGIRQLNHEALVTVNDTGCGIPEEIRGRIFDPFFTTKPTGEGSGLGLDIVKKIVDKHHGRVEVQSEMGVGSTFSVYLPYEYTAYE
ncbi:two-component system, NtrC family, sensor kinase [Gammaproteobacteria bacterium]